MRFGYWMPIFGGWLRNVRDEGMSVAWPYVRDVAVESERHGFELSLIAELNLNDIKGHRAPSLDCWTLAPAVAAVTERLELMLAVRPNYHSPALTAKALSTLDTIAPDRLSLNVVSSWWKDEAAQYGAPFDVHDARYARTQEWLDVVGRLLREETVTHDGPLYQLAGTVLEPKPARVPPIYMGGESPKAKEVIAQQADAYVMHGDAPEVIAAKIADLAARRAVAGGAIRPPRRGPGSHRSWAGARRPGGGRPRLVGSGTPRRHRDGGPRGPPVGTAGPPRRRTEARVGSGSRRSRRG